MHSAETEFFCKGRKKSCQMSQTRQQPSCAHPLSRSLFRFCIFRVTSDETAVPRVSGVSSAAEVEWPDLTGVEETARPRDAVVACFVIVIALAARRRSGRSGWQTDSSRGHWSTARQQSSIFVSDLDTEHRQATCSAMQSKPTRSLQM